MKVVDHSRYDFGKLQPGSCQHVLVKMNTELTHVGQLRKREGHGNEASYCPETAGRPRAKAMQQRSQGRVPGRSDSYAWLKLYNYEMVIVVEDKKKRERMK